MKNYPTVRQRRAIWVSVTFILVVAAGILACWLVLTGAKVFNFLQPVLIPFAIAAVLAFLLDPIVRFFIRKTRLKHTSAVWILFVIILLVMSFIGLLIVPPIYRQTTEFISKFPVYSQKAQVKLLSTVEKLDALSQKWGHLLQTNSKEQKGEKVSQASTDNAAGTTAPTGNTTDTTTPSGNALSPTPLSTTPPTGTTAPPPSTTSPFKSYIETQLPLFSKQIPQLLESTFNIIIGSIGGFMGAFGFLMNAVIIPVYLYFLLVEGPNIKQRWSDYLPLQNSPLKYEIVSTLTEINHYLVAFFRGQLIVSTIDGILIATGLSIVGLDFALLVGLITIPLSFIPYLGIVLSFIPACLIAIIQFGDFLHPALIALVILIVQNLEGYLIAPKIIGNSVGLHPLTIIVSVFAWSLLFNGPLGAILAVPLTASLKVLMRRYIWEKATVRPQGLPSVPPQPSVAPGS